MSQAGVEKNKTEMVFTCNREVDHLPPIDKEADILFQRARWLQKQASPQDFKSIGRLYRIAAANDHFKAANNLHKLVSTGSVDSVNPPAETIDLVQQLIKKNVPAGFYAMGHYLELGYGVEVDKEKALAYFRKAADMGNADAQYYLAERLAPLEEAPALAKQMRECAMAQGHAQAANALGIDLQTDKSFEAAIKAFQIATKNGNPFSALALEEAFQGPPASNELYYLAVAQDQERVKRYRAIGKFIDRYDGRNPQVPDIDKIVPLPPAPLPAWDGTFEWEKEFKSAKAPEMPSEALIKKLAQAKGLDPLTGLPLAKGK